MKHQTLEILKKELKLAEDNQEFLIKQMQYNYIDGVKACINAIEESILREKSINAIVKRIVQKETSKGGFK